MPNRKQIIIFSVLGLTALLIGYFKNPLNLSMGKRAEVQGPVPPTIVTNVITNFANNTVPIKPTPNPVKPKPLTPRVLTLEEKKIVGTYERKGGSDTLRFIFLDNGIMEQYINGKKQNADSKWSIVGNELHTQHPNSHVLIYRSNPDNSITVIAFIGNGKRIDIPKEQQATTYKKISLPEPTRTLTLEEKDIVGTYEHKFSANTYRYVFLDNGLMEWYVDGKKQNIDWKWSIVEKEIHIEHPNNYVYVWKLNPDNSIARIATIRDGKRTDTPKEKQQTYTKIK